MTGNTRNNRPQVIASIIYIHQNLDKCLTLDAIASNAALSKYHFHRLFKHQTGESLYQYIKRTRLEYAMQYLIETDEPILEISVKCGYKSVAAFSKAFRQAYLISPREFKKGFIKLQRSSPWLKTP